MEDVFPFHNTSMDFTDVMLYKSKYIRKWIFLKAYVALLGCYTAHAIHVELVFGLDVDHNMNACNRFTYQETSP